jgi:hypothetical protein
MQTNRSFGWATLLVLFLTCLSACEYGGPIFDCDQEQKKAVKSDDGKFSASVLLVQCGATTRDATWILVSPHDRSVDSERDRAAVFEGSDVDIRWVGGVLEISYGDAKLFRNESTLHGAAIKYVKRN